MMKKAFPLLAIGLGVAGGILHGLDLVYGYDSMQLPTGAPWLKLLYFLWLLSVFICLAVAFGYRKTGDKYQAFECYLTGGGDQHKFVAVLCAGIFMACGLIGLYYTATHIMELPMFERVTLIPLYLLAGLSGLALIRIAGSAVRGGITQENAVMIFIPIFWAALDLVNTFKANGSTPMEGQFVFELLAAGGLLCGLHAYGRFFFSTPRPRLFAALGGLGVVWGLTGGIGTLLQWLMGSRVKMELIPRAGCYIACALWLAYQLLRMAFCDESQPKEEKTR